MGMVIFAALLLMACSGSDKLTGWMEERRGRSEARAELKNRVDPHFLDLYSSDSGVLSWRVHFGISGCGAANTLSLEVRETAEEQGRSVDELLRESHPEVLPVSAELRGERESIRVILDCSNFEKTEAYLVNVFSAAGLHPRFVLGFNDVMYRELKTLRNEATGR